MVLVTGATGLVGSYLVLHLLEQGQVVKALFRNEKSKARTQAVFVHEGKSNLFPQIQWCQADILDIPSLEIAFQNIKFVYHCAAFISFDPKEEELLRKTNIEGTANIVNFCIDRNVEKLCYVSSIAALGDLKETEKFVTEETEWNPEKEHSDYAISKYGGEMEVWRGQQEGLKVVVVNPGVILGPVFWEDGSGEIYQKIKKGWLFYTKGSTGFVSVTDVVQVMTKLMESSISGEKFILVSENMTYQNLVVMIAGILRARKPNLYAGKMLTSFCWRLDWFLSSVFSKKRTLTKNLAQSVHSNDYYANAKIMNHLQYSFESIDSSVRK